MRQGAERRSPCPESGHSKASIGGLQEIYKPEIHLSGLCSWEMVLSLHQILKGASDPKD